MSTRVETALAKLQQYLQDEIPPSGAADAVATVMAQPPDLFVHKVGAWSVEESRRMQMPVFVFLVHALKKVYVVGELGLLDREAIASYLDRATTALLRVCPAEERDRLRNAVAEMRMSRDVDAARPKVQVIHATLPTFSGNVATPSAEDEAQAARRFSMIVDRLTKQMQSGGDQPPPVDAQALSQLVTMAATRSHNGEQLNSYLEQIRPFTGGKEGNVFIILGGGLPSWDIPDAAPGTVKPPAQVGAMEKIIDLAEDPKVAMQRFRDLVTAAVAKFNEGALAASVWMLDVAHDSITEKKLDLAEVNRIRETAVDGIAQVQLRKYAENKRRHAALKLVLGFFPTLQLDVLLRQLRGEPRAERRRTLLGFLEAHGVAGRDAALEQLEAEQQRPDADTYYLRNLIYLLHRVARDSDDTLGRELQVLAKASARGQIVYVIKEAVTALGQIKSEDSVKLLITRLAESESALMRGEAGAGYPAGEGPKLLDRIAASLSRIGTPAALLAVARHGMETSPALGDARARLAGLSQYDLSFDEKAVTVLVKALRDEIPGKLFGRLLPKKQDRTVRLIEALASTRSDDVDELLRDIAQRFPDQDVGRAAIQVVGKRAPAEVAAPRAAEPAATLTGELEFFGLPSVLQSLAEMRATGMLTLRTKAGQAAAKVLVVGGQFLNAQVRHVRGTDALFEILERPIAGTFAFVPYPPEKMQTNITPQELIGLLFEGVRRHDELQQLTVMLPDETVLARSATVKPTTPEGEADPPLVRDVWTKITSGLTVGACEREIPADGYRVRRLLAHWLEQGALV